MGLALSLQVAEVLRNDLKILVMSATLDVAPVSKILDTNAPIISDGRAYKVNVITCLARNQKMTICGKISPNLFTMPLK